jgi:hypothetical protein
LNPSGLESIAFATFGRYRRCYNSDAVLELGSVPLPVVTARVDRFIAEGGKGPYLDMQ